MLRDFASRGHAALASEAQRQKGPMPVVAGYQHSGLSPPAKGEEEEDAKTSPVASKKSSSRPAAVHDFSVLRMRHATIFES